MARWHYEQVVDLARPEGPRTWPDLMMVEGDQDAHQWRVDVLNGGQAADLSGYNAVAYFARADGNTVVQAAAIHGNAVTVTLPQQAYAVPGPMVAVIRATAGGQTITLAKGRCVVQNGPGDSYVDPGHIVPTLDELLAQIAAMDQATASANAAAQAADEARTGIQGDLQAVNDSVDQLKGDLGYKSIGKSYSNNYNFDNFNNEIASGYWGTDYVYDSGYVKSISLKMLSTNDVFIVFISSEGKVIKKVIAENVSGVSEIEINDFINQDFTILIDSNKSMPYCEADHNNNSLFFEGSIEIGDNPSLTTYGKFDFAFIVNYLTVGNNLKQLNSAIFGKRNRMFVFGDSITACYPTFDDELKWQTEVGRALGIEITSGESSGNGYLYSTGSGNAKSIALGTDFTKFDYAVSFWGTNDYGNNMNLGSMDDLLVEGSEHTSFYGAVAYVVRTMFASNRKIVPILVTPLNRTDHGNINSMYAYGTANGVGHTLSDYCQAIVDVANRYGIPYIDNRNGAFNMFSCEIFLGDNLHPNENGYKALGQWMSAQLSKFVSPYHGEY